MTVEVSLVPYVDYDWSDILKKMSKLTRNNAVRIKGTPEEIHRIQKGCYIQAKSLKMIVTTERKGRFLIIRKKETLK